MLHPDMETRVGAHRIFVLLLVPSSVSQSSRFEHQFLPHSDMPSPSRSKKRVSAFSSAAALFERLRRERSFGGSFLDSDDEDRKLKGRTNSMGRVVGKTDSMDKDDWQLEGRSESFGRDEGGPGREDKSNGAASPSRLQAFRLSFGRSMAHLRRPSTSNKDIVPDFPFQSLISFNCSIAKFYSIFRPCRLGGWQSRCDYFSYILLQIRFSKNLVATPSFCESLLAFFRK